MKVKSIVEAYKLLGNAKTTNLDDADKGKILKARKAMRPIADEFEAFLKDAQEMFKPEGWEETQKKLAQWQQEGEKTTLSEEERIAINKALIGYQSAIDKAVKAELDKDVEIEIEKLSEGADIKLISGNDWTPNQLDLIDMMF
ncbi:MAG: hypothetical protein U0M06_02720 [Clostridia bacterium]|nr:hypothetical protein [Clostridia bacterium]